MMLSTVPFNAPVVERGVGFFETILVVGTRMVHFSEHVKRLHDTLSHLQFPAPSDEELTSACQFCIDSAQREPNKESALRLSWIAVGQDLDARSSWRLDVSLRDIPPATLKRRLGAHAVTLPASYHRDMPTVKSTNYLVCVLGSRFASSRGANEGLFISPDGTYLEGTATGLLAWNEGTLAAPKGEFLPSVTVRAFIDGEISRKPLTRADLQKGTVLLGSLTTAAPLLSIDGLPCEQPVAMLRRIAEFNERILGLAL